MSLTQPMYDQVQVTIREPQASKLCPMFLGLEVFVLGLNKSCCTHVLHWVLH
jgi:hypothetical protein